MSKRIDEHELRDLFAEIEAPPGLDQWRERIADVHAEAHDPLPETPDPDDPADDTVVKLPTGRELRPRRHKKRSVAVAAAVVAMVGLGGVVTSQLLSDSPPADPTMIIDGPDKSGSSSPPPSSSPSTSGSVSTAPPADGPPTPGDTNATGGRGTGVPLGATLVDHQGDLRISTAGQVVTDLRVTGSVIVEAPNVTLRRVVVVAPNGTPAVQQFAGNLTVQDSELSGGTSLAQHASGLTVRRSRLESGVTITSGAELYDNHLASADALIPSGSTGLLLRHNVMGRVTMTGLDGPIQGVTIEDSVLTQVDAPAEPGSVSIHVLNNRFRGGSPSTGWNPGATGYRWEGNTFLDSGTPAGP